MSKKIKFYSILAFFVIAGSMAFGQTVEIPTTSGSFPGGSGPTTAAVGPISLMRDNSNNNGFTPATGSNLITVTMSLTNQQYAASGAPNIMNTYTNGANIISTGLVFGAAPTTSTGGIQQGVDPGNTFDNLSSFSVAPGGPLDNRFTASTGLPAGTGIVGGAQFPPTGEANGAVFLFTAGQVQYDRPGGPTVNNSATRYYYGDLVINFNRFVINPVLHIAGLGGSYRYFPITGTNILDPTQWLSSYFTTELDITSYTGQLLSGNGNLAVSGSSITNSYSTPSGASEHTIGSLFDEYGAASGSVKINAAVKTIRLKIYLRGSNSSQFNWSAIGAPGPGQQISGGTRNPFPGDIWSVSVSSALAQLITLPATGINLTGSLNGNDVKLNWKTLTELNTDHFEIERSIDGVNFVSIASKAAAGLSNTELNYSQTDPNITSKVYYYRVKLVDFDNKISYSNVIVIRKTGNIKAIDVYPNPVVDNMSVVFSSAKGSYIISMYNAAGQEVQNRKADITSDVQTVTLNRGSLNAGTYFIKVKNINDPQDVFNQKVVLQ